jgi:hypothetical protein
LIGNIVGTPAAGNKNFTARAGSIGAEKGVNKKLRMAIGLLKKTEEFKKDWDGSISITGNPG